MSSADTSQPLSTGRKRRLAGDQGNADRASKQRPLPTQPAHPADLTTATPSGSTPTPAGKPVMPTPAVTPQVEGETCRWWRRRRQESILAVGPKSLVVPPPPPPMPTPTPVGLLALAINRDSLRLAPRPHVLPRTQTRATRGRQRPRPTCHRFSGCS